MKRPLFCRVTLSAVAAIVMAGTVVPVVASEPAAQASPVAAPVSAEAKTAASLRQGWQDAATFLINDANKTFAKTKVTSEGNKRERLLGEAVTLLNVQPRTEGNLGEARKMFEEIVAGNPDDEAGIFASFFLARWHETYEQPPQFDLARKLYRDLLERHAGNPLAESGASSLVMMDVYENVSTEERTRRFAELEKLLPLLKTPSGRRDFHLSMGNSYIDFSESPAKAIEHLMAADAEGISRWQIESATWISIGELARSQGDTALAARYYKKFLEKYKRDNRHYSIEKRLEALPSTAPSTP